METQNRFTDSPSLFSVIREVRTGFVNVVRNDVSLAAIEMKETTGRLKKDAIQLGVFGVMAALGVFPLIAFLVIGLGRIFDDNFWLSSLIVALVHFAVGGALAYRALNRLKGQELSFPHTRSVLDQEIEAVDKKLHSLADTAKKKGRAA